MLIGERLRKLRELNDLSQGDIEARTGLLRCYISRVENGHTVPSLETLERLAAALEVPLYSLFFEGDTPSNSASGGASPSNGLAPEAEAAERFFEKVKRAVDRISEKDRKLLFYMAQKLARD